MDRSKAGLFQLIVLFLINLSIFSAPLFISCKYTELSAVSRALYYIWSFNCHQIPARSFFLFNTALPVCARCTGIWLGALVFAVFLALKKNIGSKKPISLLKTLLLSLPLIIDGVGQAFGYWESFNNLRFVTGLLFGISWAAFLIPWVNLFAEDYKKAWLKFYKPIKKLIKKLPEITLSRNP